MKKDERLGKVGEYRPEKTLQGNPVDKNQPPASIIQLSGGWYIELDRFRNDNWQELLNELQEQIKPKSRSMDKASKGHDEDEVI